jgi:hypothetical protein
VGVLIGILEDFSRRLSEDCEEVGWDCCSMGVSFLGAVQKRLSRNQIFFSDDFVGV